MGVSIVTMQAAGSKHAAAVESLKEGWVAELKRQKEAWAAAEKARRDTWVADKTKQVKELTVKVSSSLCANAECDQTPLVLPPLSATLGCPLVYGGMPQATNTQWPFELLLKCTTAVMCAGTHSLFLARQTCERLTCSAIVMALMNPKPSSSAVCQMLLTACCSLN